VTVLAKLLPGKSYLEKVADLGVI